MEPRQEIEKRIARKKAEIGELEAKIRDANSHLSGLQEALKLIPKASVGATAKVSTKQLRHNSAVAKARAAILKAGGPLHISEILKALGQPLDRKHRSNLSGSLGAYARKGQVFTRPEPNTFGLIEVGEAEGEKVESNGDDGEEDEENRLRLN